jgi:hypothetical protein
MTTGNSGFSMTVRDIHEENKQDSRKFSIYSDAVHVGGDANEKCHRKW